MWECLNFWIWFRPTHRVEFETDSWTAGRRRLKPVIHYVHTQPTSNHLHIQQFDVSVTAFMLGGDTKLSLWLRLLLSLRITPGPSEFETTGSWGGWGGREMKSRRSREAEWCWGVDVTPPQTGLGSPFGRMFQAKRRQCVGLSVETDWYRLQFEEGRRRERITLKPWDEEDKKDLSSSHISRIVFCLCHSVKYSRKRWSHSGTSGLSVVKHCSILIWLAF